jgi:hypothetical protein
MIGSSVDKKTTLSSGYYIYAAPVLLLNAFANASIVGLVSGKAFRTKPAASMIAFAALYCSGVSVVILSSGNRILTGA